MFGFESIEIAKLREQLNERAAIVAASLQVFGEILIENGFTSREELEKRVDSYKMKIISEQDQAIARNREEAVKVIKETPLWKMVEKLFGDVQGKAVHGS